MKEKMIAVFKDICKHHRTTKVQQNREWTEVSDGLGLTAGIVKRTFTKYKDDSFSTYSLRISQVATSTEKHEPITEEEYNELQQIVCKIKMEQKKDQDESDRRSVSLLEREINKRFRDVTFNQVIGNIN